VIIGLWILCIGYRFEIVDGKKLGSKTEHELEVKETLRTHICCMFNFRVYVSHLRKENGQNFPTIDQMKIIGLPALLGDLFSRNFSYRTGSYCSSIGTCVKDNLNYELQLHMYKKESSNHQVAGFCCCIKM
jgi:hypothetical protein